MYEETNLQVLSASTMTGDRVRNSEGEDLGHIRDLMIDIPSGRVVYAVLSFGDAAEDKLFAVPWNKLHLNPRDKVFQLNVDKRLLEKSAGFDTNHWPDMANPRWHEDLHRYCDTKPYWESLAHYTG
jgi:sporulation protein YlmC with PRC-barrel domain